MRYTMTAIEAAQTSRCSLHCIITHIKKGNIEAIRVPSPRRLAWRINRESFESFYNSYLSVSKRVGRELPKAREHAVVLNKGYRHVRCPDHPRASFQGYVPEHVLIAEKKLQRRIKKGEEVHHINGIKTDNRPENLIVYSSRGAHHAQGHGRFMSIRTKLVQLLRNPDFDPSVLTVEQKAELFDSLIKDALA